MSSHASRIRPVRSRSRRQRLAAGAVLATTGLLGTYMAALRPQPTYAAPLGSAAHESDSRTRTGPRSLAPSSIPTCGQADITVTDDTGLRSAIVSSRDDSVICISGTITVLSDLPDLDDTTVTFVGDDSTVDVIDGQDYFALIAADFSGPGDDTVTIAGLGLSRGTAIASPGRNSGGAAYFVGRIGDEDALVIDGSLLTDSNAQLQGGAVYAKQGNVSITDSFLTGNYTATFGSAAWLQSSDVTVADTTISGNDALYAATVFSLYSTVNVSTVSMTGNYSTAGGNLYLSSSTARLENSFVGSNTTPGGVGGIFANGSDVDLVFTTVYGNSSVAGSPSELDLVAGSVDSWGSVVGSPSDDTTMRLTGGAVLDDTYSVSTGQGPGFSGPGSHDVTGGTLQLAVVDDTQTPGHGGRTPAVTSLLVTGAPTDDVDTGVNVDQVGNLRPGSGTTWTIGSRQVNFTPQPPTPPPAFPPSAPRDVTATPGDGSAVVSWTPPSDPGSFPVTNYRVIAQPGGPSCLVTAPTTTCTIEGLTNGRPYTFTVEALNGAGWGPPSRPSEPVTPEARIVALVLDQGVRVAAGAHDRIRTTGSSVNVPAGVRLTPHIRYSGQTSFSRGKATITVQSDGTFRWTRKIKKDRGLTAYVSWQDVDSNRVYWAKVR